MNQYPTFYMRDREYGRAIEAEVEQIEAEYQTSLPENRQVTDRPPKLIKKWKTRK